MAGRRIFDEQDARRCLAAAKSSRDGLAGWAQAHCVDGGSLNAWRVNLERRGVPRKRAVGPKLVELVVAPSALGARSPYVLHVHRSPSSVTPVSCSSRVSAVKVSTAPRSSFSSTSRNAAAPPADDFGA